jgi:hypothetical protein
MEWFPSFHFLGAEIIGMYHYVWLLDYILKEGLKELGDRLALSDGMLVTHLFFDSEWVPRLQMDHKFQGLN